MYWAGAAATARALQCWCRAGPHGGWCRRGAEGHSAPDLHHPPPAPHQAPQGRRTAHPDGCSPLQQAGGGGGAPTGASSTLITSLGAGPKVSLKQKVAPGLPPHHIPAR